MHERAVPGLPQQEGLSPPQTETAHGRVRSFHDRLPSLFSGIPQIESWCESRLLIARPSKVTRKTRASSLEIRVKLPWRKADEFA